MKKTIAAMTNNIIGSIMRTNMSRRRKVVRSKLSDICTITFSKVLDSSATEIISTTWLGKCPEAAKGDASF